MLRQLREYVPSQEDRGEDKPKKEYGEYPGGLNRTKVEKIAKGKLTDQVRREEVKQIVQESAEARRQEREARVTALEQAQAALQKSKDEGAANVRKYEADLKAKGFRGDIEHSLLKRARLQAVRGDEKLRSHVADLMKVGKQKNKERREELQGQPKKIRKAVSERVTQIESKNDISAEATRMIQEARDQAKRLAKNETE